MAAGAVVGAAVGRVRRTRRPAYHHGDLEQALVTEALRRVRDRGADAVSLRQVAQAVGVSPSAAYAHFPDKTALMTAVGRLGMAELDARMVAAVQAVPGDDDRGALTRFHRAGYAYLGFAVEQPHLFRHIFGPECAKAVHQDRLHATISQTPDESVAYQVLCATLDDLSARGLLRADSREGLDLLAWTTVHGFSSLVLDGFSSIEAGPLLITTLSRLILSDHAQALTI